MSRQNITSTQGTPRQRLVARLGLPADASDAQILTAVDTARTAARPVSAETALYDAAWNPKAVSTSHVVSDGGALTWTAADDALVAALGWGDES